MLTGAGHGFCSGADLEDPGAIPHIDGLTLPAIAMRSMELLDEVIRTLRRLHQPVIAAVNGAGHRRWLLPGPGHRHPGGRRAAPTSGRPASTTG